MGLGYVEGITHDYVRHGTTTLFAALDIATGAVFTECKPRHRHQEFLSFLRHLDQSVPPELDHLIVDNYATHKHPKVRTWLAQRPRYHMHYTPTYSSWLNQVEGWFGLITSSAPFAVVRSPAFKTWRGKSDAFGQHYKCSSRLSLDGYCRFHPAEDCSTLFAYFRDTTLAACGKTQLKATLLARSRMISSHRRRRANSFLFYFFFSS